MNDEETREAEDTTPSRGKMDKRTLVVALSMLAALAALLAFNMN